MEGAVRDSPAECSFGVEESVSGGGDPGEPVVVRGCVDDVVEDDDVVQAVVFDVVADGVLLFDGFADVEGAVPFFSTGHVRFVGEDVVPEFL